MVKIKLTSGFVSTLRDAGYKLGKDYTYSVYQYGFGGAAVVFPKLENKEELEIYLRLRFEAAE